ncbi:MAG: imidazolonepropionase, partial [Roseovarius sp.]
MLFRNATLATMQAGRPYGLVPGGALLIDAGRIVWVGQDHDLPSGYDGPEKNLEGRVVTPALIDCHTHVVHGGNRSAEFEMRLQGASYEEVARAGGGILST